MKKYKIAPSILSADFAHLGDEVDKVLAAGADLIHFDVMDNQFVPNLTIGPMVCNSLHKYRPDIIIDVHLMIKPVDKLIKPFAEAGASIISFHPQASENIKATIDLIHHYGCKAGLAINPDLGFENYKPYLDDLQLLLIMSVFPGFGGQKFIPDSLAKIKQAHELIADRDIELEVDGGINVENIGNIAGAGADILVCGSAIFKSDNYANTISKMRQQLESSRYSCL